MKKERETNMELLRVVAMFCIVFYHLLTHVVIQNTTLPIYSALQIPLHIGVPLFVLISGYFGIRASFSGVVKLLLPVVTFYIPIELVGRQFFHYDGMRNTIQTLLFISHSPFWFVRTYLWLFLFSPVINYYLKNADSLQRLYLLLALGVISVYFGTVYGDSSLYRGTNLVNFVFLYVVGNTISRYKSVLEKISTKWLLGGFTLLNLLILILYLHYWGTSVTHTIIQLCFRYCSPILLTNAILLFCVFSKLRFRSAIVNKVASSTFSMYIISETPFVLYVVITPLVLSLCPFDNVVLSLAMLTLLTIAIMFICFLEDCMAKPLFKYIVSKCSSSPVDAFFKNANM